ncbi:MAG: NAD-dependent dehydratase, partial [Baekduiaceae bacterium]
MDVAIAGGHGQIALQLAALLAARGDHARALIRNPGHEADVRAAGRAPR